MFQKPDVIVIGAGPVGLWTAIQLKLRDPNLKIQMFEKYSSYQRSHTLYIESSSLVGVPKDDQFKELISDFTGYIKTNDLENQLLEFADDIGIKIKHQAITDCHALKKQFPDTKAFIGADGSRSIVRQQMFDNELTINKNLKHIVEIKYEVKGKSRKLNTASEQLWSQLAKSHHIVSEHVGKEKDGITPISLRLFVDKKTFDKLDGVTFRNPASIDSEHYRQICPKLFATIDNWLQCREHFVGDGELHNVKITRVPLNMYQSKKVTMIDQDNKRWNLVGDSAFGLPFFRALNDGFLCGTSLALDLYYYLHPEKDIKSDITHSLTSVSNFPFQDYQHFFNHLTTYEKMIARLKSIGLESGIQSFNASQTSTQPMIHFSTSHIIKPISDWLDYFSSSSLPKSRLTH